MIGMDILKPVVALAVWTMVMWWWLYLTRVPAMKAAAVDPDRLVRDPGATLDNVLPPQVQWKAHNYNHLHEAPTVFYAVALVLALVGKGDGISATIAWVYVALRVVHSLQQALFNRVVVRFALFALSSFALMALVVQAVRAVFSA